MKGNLLQGTYTPTLTPMPGVHNSFHRIAALLRFGMNVKGLGGAANDDRQRWTAAESVLLLEGEK